ncbi:MAG: hypothetical protein FJ220_05095 [Kiritimatiellaceae bacterium]|nr:hypothetical protein [Kiritimatiellaceae bacterium]
MTNKSEEQTLTEQAVTAMRDAVRHVVEDHRRRNRPLATWENGQVVYRHPDSGQVVKEVHVPYMIKPENKIRESER